MKKRGSGLGTGPVGSATGRVGGTGNPSGGKRSGGSNVTRGTASLGAVAAVVFYIFTKFMGGGSDGTTSSVDVSSLLSTLGSGTSISSAASSTWTSQTASLDNTVAKGSREKYTTVKGGGNDTVTIMVYMCGTDLESKSGMGTSDLQEMLAAKTGDNVNLIVYTGGCKEWKNNAVSSKVNQIYQIKDGQFICLEKDMGTGAMVNPDTLVSFIQYCNKNFPANRNDLIFWDHGGGSLSGYGYDEKNASSGSMSLAKIDQALSKAGIKYDFIGFDACLMATLENGLMLSKYADYMIASEETEPGVGWYYTDWLNALAANPSMDTLTIGKNIVDGFIDTCDKKCAGQKTTLSVVDLAELENTVPDKLTSFASATKDMIQNEEYQTVSDARNNTREFAVSSKIDQIDLVHLAQNMNNSEGSALEAAVKGAVKYNRTSSNMTNANGLSIYFPYKKASKVDSAVKQYQQIGMDSEYTKCIQEFASVEVTGQSAGQTASQGITSGSTGSLMNLLVSGLGGDMGGLDLSSLSFLTGRNREADIAYVEDNSFDVSALKWTKESDGYKLKLTEDQWKLIQKIDVSVFYDDGEGYIDLGLDNVYEFDKYGNLIGDYDNSWISINNQPVAYYHTDTVEEGKHYSITGYVPALLNGDRVNLNLVFDDANPYGYIASINYVYKNNETDTTAKNFNEVRNGDTLEFICDYYTYDGKYEDSYLLGDPITIGETIEISNTTFTGNVQVMYRLTDIYCQNYWTPVLP